MHFRLPATRHDKTDFTHLALLYFQFDPKTAGIYSVLAAQTSAGANNAMHALEPELIGCALSLSASELMPSIHVALDCTRTRTPPHIHLPDGIHNHRLVKLLLRPFRTASDSWDERLEMTRACLLFLEPASGSTGDIRLPD